MAAKQPIIAEWDYFSSALQYMPFTPSNSILFEKWFGFQNWNGRMVLGKLQKLSTAVRGAMKDHFGNQRQMCEEHYSAFDGARKVAATQGWKFPEIGPGVRKATPPQLVSQTTLENARYA
ncbi:hypothetical protein FOZ61_006632 [Perkinsus olseni]|uniref:Uncharacterized protein n=1 Tax=Perkinsus olseni TaxID=32597 RepID=A0A7J6LCA2_PEROL|nr:hypothetical protein FOZ61_006632 [Perkinsus olseni]